MKNANSLALLLQGVVDQAGRALPAQSGVVDRAQQERERVNARFTGAARGVAVLLLDVSSSMAEAAGLRPKWQILRDALCVLDGEIHLVYPSVHYIAFGSIASEIPSPQSIPSPSGSTAMESALDLAGAQRPIKTVVISDGRPNDPAAALAAADRLTGGIDVIYVGPDDDLKALGFMQRLARVGGGTVHARDLRRDAGASQAQLCSAVRITLALPAKGGGG